MTTDAEFDRYFRLLGLAATAERMGAADRAADFRGRADKIIERERAVRLGFIKS